MRATACKQSSPPASAVSSADPPPAASHPRPQASPPAATGLGTRPCPVAHIPERGPDSLSAPRSTSNVRSQRIHDDGIAESGWRQRARGLHARDEASEATNQSRVRPRSRNSDHGSSRVSSANARLSPVRRCEGGIVEFAQLHTHLVVEDRLRQCAFALQDLIDSFLQGAHTHQSVDDNRMGLADPVGAVGCLVFDGGVPPVIAGYDVRHEAAAVRNVRMLRRTSSGSRIPRSGASTRDRAALVDDRPPVVAVEAPHRRPSRSTGNVSYRVERVPSTLGGGGRGVLLGSGSVQTTGAQVRGRSAWRPHRVRLA